MYNRQIPMMLTFSTKPNTGDIPITELAQFQGLPVYLVGKQEVATKEMSGNANEGHTEVFHSV